eukprot:TRINITY_DN52521_c0_g1_i1.p1 TRINITY_DN52521_c0_g1~~TRINITY_DN52521_c0_g1_i1.p1  ORF type:complete len:176 (-),score=34.85 TRINITY_DN52521_c0_g1_i1:343-870(-)
MATSTAEDSSSALPSGDVILRYNMYNEAFPVTEGRLSATAIDEVYCLSDVMPGCKIHLSRKSPEEKYGIESSGETVPFVFEDPPGAFHGIEVGSEYFVYVDEDETEFLKSQELARRLFGESDGSQKHKGIESDSYTSAFKEVMQAAKEEGAKKGLEGEELSAFVQQKLEEFNKNQ